MLQVSLKRIVKVVVDASGKEMSGVWILRDRIEGDGGYEPRVPSGEWLVAKAIQRAYSLGNSWGL